MAFKFNIKKETLFIYALSAKTQLIFSDLQEY